MTDRQRGVIVFGPAACGKSHNAEALRAHFGLKAVHHEWDGRQRLKEFVDTLVLTNVNLDGLTYQDFRVVSFDDAMKEAGLPNNYRHGRQWCPADWMDEVPPALGKTPDQFLKRNADGVLQLFPLGASNEEPEDIEWMVRGLKDGDVVVFDWTEKRGSHAMTVKSDGSWSLDAPFPADTNCYDDEDGNFQVTSDLSEIAGLWREQQLVGQDDEVTFEVEGWTWSFGTAFRVRAMESGSAHFEEISAEGPFQPRVSPWMQACFGPVISSDTVERNDRFIEEALELIQACGGDRQRAHQLVDYVFDRPVGEKWQETGGVMVTLAALCLANGIDMHAAGERELLRIWTKVDKIRAKQAAKPTGSALPEYVPEGRRG